MRAWTTIALCGLAPLVGCGSPEAAVPDAAASVDAGPTAAAETVTCPTTPDSTVGVSGHAYLPESQTIAVGDVVKFTTNADHSAASLEHLFAFGFFETGCVRFNAPGTYTFYCTVHGFTGTVTAQ